MKKIICLLIVLSTVLVACEATPAAPTVVPTEKPTAVPTEKPTAVPTEEPTAVPTEEPTAVPTEELPESCPLDSSTLPEDITMDLGIYGEYELTDAIDFKLFIMHPMLLNARRQGEDVSTLYNKGGNFSFEMPSPGLVNTGKNTRITVNDELWGEEGFAVSTSGNFVIPTGAQVMIETEGGLEGQESIIEVYFLSGTQIKVDDISLPENSTLSCKEGLWQITISNIDSQDKEVLVNTGHFMFFAEADNLLGIKSPRRGDLEPTPGMFFSNEEITLLIQGGTSVTGWILDLYGKD